MLRRVVPVSSHSEEKVSHSSELIKMERMCYPDLAVGFLRGSYLELCVVDTFEVIPRSRSVIPSFGNASPSPS